MCYFLFCYCNITFFSLSKQWMMFWFLNLPEQTEFLFFCNILIHFCNNKYPVNFLSIKFMSSIWVFCELLLPVHKLKLKKMCMIFTFQKFVKLFQNSFDWFPCCQTGWFVKENKCWNSNVIKKRQCTVLCVDTEIVYFRFILVAQSCWNQIVFCDSIEHVHSRKLHTGRFQSCLGHI